MNKTETKKYIRLMADSLGLKDWKIEVNFTDCDPNCIAQVGRVYGRKWGQIRIGEKFDKASEKDKKSAIIHELLHLHQAPMYNFVETLGLNPETMRTFDVITEYIVDGLSVGIADNYNLKGGITNGKAKRS